MRILPWKENTMKRSLICCVLTVLLLALALPVFGGEAPEAETLEDAIKNGQPLLTFRYRFEEVDQANIDKKAHASTLRTTVGYRSGVYKGFSFLVEAEDVTVVGDAQAYNNKGFDCLNNGVTDRPVVADPALTEINQAYFQWKNSANKAHVGRREIIIGDARFVGNVGWRQNHQSFDAFAFTNSSLDFADLSYRFVNKVNRIFGDVQDMNSHLINADVKVGEIGKLGLYGYMLDYTRPENYGGSTATWGAEFKGKSDLGENLDLLFEAEYAMQSDYGDNPNEVEASYFHLMAGVALKPVTLKVGYEVLGGDVVDVNNPDDVYKGRFITPLATLHKWNGWADKFLGTPGAGLNDLYFQASGMIGPVKGLAAYHIFTADDGDADFGKEFDIQFTYKTSWKQTFGLKAALYSTDSPEVVPPATPLPYEVDTNKFWVFTAYSI
jgi:hypothetical protein